jgi:glycosyltransferase involved in cell wall biosynthesis
VRDGETGRVVEPTVDAVAAALAIGEDDARAWGRAGKVVAEQVTWDRAIDRLLA